MLVEYTEMYWVKSTFKEKHFYRTKYSLTIFPLSNHYSATTWETQKLWRCHESHSVTDFLFYWAIWNVRNSRYVSSVSSTNADCFQHVWTYCGETDVCCVCDQLMLDISMNWVSWYQKKDVTLNMHLCYTKQDPRCISPNTWRSRTIEIFGAVL